MHPKPVQFRTTLKISCVAHFLATPSTGSYDQDDSSHLLNFIEENTKPEEVDRVEFSEESAMDILAEAATCSLDVCESNGLYYVMGWAIKQELGKVGDCDICRDAFVAAHPVSSHECPETILTLLKSYTKDKNFTTQEITFHLCHLTQGVLRFFHEVELQFQY